MKQHPQKEPTRALKTDSPDLPPFGPEVPGCKPHLPPSIYCSWCGAEMTVGKGDISRCPGCDS